MKEIRTDTIIDARPEVVWKILTEFYDFPGWSKFIRSISGEARSVENLEVIMQNGSGKDTRFKPTVLISEPEKEFRWKGKFKGMGWLFSGEHYFLMEALSDQRTRFVHGEKFGGALIPILWRSLNTDTRRGFMDFNKALKRRAESTT